MDFVRHLIIREFRRGGFIGSVRVTNLRATKRGFSARAVATKGVHRATYRCSVGGGKVRLVRLGDPVRVAV